MKIDEIKNKILQLAIQGKLVPQDEKDEPASVLLEKIRAEKEQLIKEKKIKKEKILPEISEEEKAFDIPEVWEWVRLRELVYNSGQKVPDSEFCYIDVSSIDNKRNQLGIDDKIISPENAPSRARKIVNNGDVIYSTVRPYLHNICVIDREFEKEAIVSTAFAVMTTCKGVINRYLFRYLLSETFDDYVNNSGNSKGVAYPAITEEKLYNAVIALPPLEEQKRIVAKVDELFSIVDQISENKEAMTKCISDTRNKVLQLAIEGKLVKQDERDEPASVLLEKIREEKKKLIQEKKIKKEKALPEISEEEKEFEIPKGWEWCRLDSIGTTNIGLTYKPSDISDMGIPVLRSSNIQNGKMDYDDLVCVSSEVPENKMCKIDDILICARNGSKRLVGKCALIDREGMSFGAFMAIFRSEYNKYINIFLNSELFRNQLGDSNTVTINQITQSMLRNTVCSLPPLEEQKRIVAKIDQVMTYLDHLEQALLS